MSTSKSAKTNALFSKLVGTEPWWRDHSQILESREYRLRPRYQTDWVPSWLNSGKSALVCEDHIQNLQTSTVDAIHISDSKRVCLKRIAVPAKGEEVAITKFFSSADRVDDIHNHCVPVVDYFEDEGIQGYGILVTPLLRSFNIPPFVSIDEVLEFVRQTLEGLVFMHDNNIAHRDIAPTNILLDEKGQMYPNGSHPLNQEANIEYTRLLNPGRRRHAKNLRYFFIDFGVSSQFPSQEDRKLVTGCMAADATIPELSESVAYDPFALDVYTLGNVYRDAFMQKYSNLKFLSPLVEAMTRQDPSARPTAPEAQAIFGNILKRKLKMLLRLRLTPVDAFWLGNCYRGMANIKDEIGFQIYSGASLLSRIKVRAVSSKQGSASSLHT